jgi:hypothetical protein
MTVTKEGNVLFLSIFYICHPTLLHSVILASTWKRVAPEKCVARHLEYKTFEFKTLQCHYVAKWRNWTRVFAVQLASICVNLRQFAFDTEVEIS